MGITGMGQAFNLQYQRRGNVNIHKSAPQQYNRQTIFPQYQMPAFQQTTQIEVQNGPGGFWGFMQAFTEQGGFQGLFDGLGKILGGGKTSEPQGINGNNGNVNGNENNDNNVNGNEDNNINGNDNNEDNNIDGNDNNDNNIYSSPGGENWSAAEPSDLADGAQIRVHDDVKGGGTDINGETKLSSDKSDDGYPKTITVKGYTYEYQRTDNGVAIYKSTSAIAAGDEYRLEKNSDGSFGLNQYAGDKGAGSIDISSRSTVAGSKQSPNSGKVNVPKNWGRVNQVGQQLLKAGLVNGSIKTADDLAKWLKTTQSGQTIFKNDLIKNNPSIFGPDGKVKANADFSKLDIPNGYSVMIPNDL